MRALWAQKGTAQQEMLQAAGLVADVPDFVEPLVGFMVVLSIGMVEATCLLLFVGPPLRGNQNDQVGHQEGWGEAQTRGGARPKREVG